MDWRCPGDTGEIARAWGYPKSGSANPAKVTAAVARGPPQHMGQKMIKYSRRV